MEPVWVLHVPESELAKVIEILRAGMMQVAAPDYVFENLTDFCEEAEQFFGELELGSA